MISVIEKMLNMLALEKLRLMKDLINLNVQLEKQLCESRMNLSKARVMRGPSLVDGGYFLMNSSLRSNVSVAIDKDLTFSLQIIPINEITYEDNENDRNDRPKSCSQSEKRTYKAFRLFGMLEPSPVGVARKHICNSLHVICEIASVKGNLNSIISDYFRLKKEL